MLTASTFCATALNLDADFNLDKKIDIIDLVCMKKAIVNYQENKKDYNVDVFDASGNVSYSAEDIVALINYIIGKTDDCLLPSRNPITEEF